MYKMCRNYLYRIKYFERVLLLLGTYPSTIFYRLASSNIVTLKFGWVVYGVESLIIR